LSAKHVQQVKSVASIDNLVVDIVGYCL